MLPIGDSRQAEERNKNVCSTIGWIYTQKLLAKIVLWAVFEFENDLLHNIISDLFTFFTSLLIDKLDHLDSIWN